MEEGKVCHAGVSNFDVAQIREFSRPRPVQTVQSPYHLFRRDIEAEVLPYTQRHDIGVLVYGPLSHGLLTGSMSPNSSFAEEDWRSASPVFRGSAFRRNLEVVDELQRFAADSLGCTVAQLAIAWTMANSAVDVDIVGARRTAHTQESLAAAGLSLTETELQQIDRIMARSAPVGGPSPEAMPSAE